MLHQPVELPPRAYAAEEVEEIHTIRMGLQIPLDFRRVLFKQLD